MLGRSGEEGGGAERNGPYAAIAANNRSPRSSGITVCHAPSELTHMALRTSPFIVALVIGEETEA